MIKINSKEKKLFDLLLHVLEVKKLKTVLRVAGGWVRDKLLKTNSDDIDIAIDDMTRIKAYKV